MNRFNLDERVLKYLTNKQPDLTPGYQIDNAARQGMAGGFSQLGTVHGYTPSAQPYIDSAKQMQQLSGKTEPAVDPRLIQYLMSKKNKEAQFKAMPRPLQGNKQGFYNPADPTQIIEGPELYEAPRQATSSKSSAPPNKFQQEQAATEYLKNKQLDLFDQIENDFMTAYKNNEAGPIAGLKSAGQRALNYSVSEEYDRAASLLGKNLATYIKEQSGTAASDTEVRRLSKLMPSMRSDPARFKVDMQILRDETMNVINSLRAAKGLPELPKRGSASTPSTKQPLSAEEKAELEMLRAKKKGVK